TTRLNGDRWRRPAAAGAWNERAVLLQRRRRRLRRVGELHGPRALLAGIDLEEAGALEATGETVLDPADGEFLVARAHVGASRPFAAAVIVDGIDIIETRHQAAAQQRVASARRQVPPALGGPALGVLVADRHPDPARRV